MSMDMAGDLMTACLDWKIAVELGDDKGMKFIDKNC
jgi:hypothetical protein